jgi:hypothetical protein
MIPTWWKLRSPHQFQNQILLISMVLKKIMSVYIVINASRIKFSEEDHSDIARREEFHT